MSLLLTRPQPVSSLSLLVLRVDADHTDDSRPLNDLAFFTNLFYTGPDFHGLCLGAVDCRAFLVGPTVLKGDSPSHAKGKCLRRTGIVPAPVPPCLVTRPRTVAGASSWDFRACQARSEATSPACILPGLAKLSTLETLRRLVAIPAPPGEEDELREALVGLLERKDVSVDAKGNLIVGQPDARVAVVAHMDEVAMMVTDVLYGTVSVTPLGGLYPWKIGEGPVEIFANQGRVAGVLGFGGIHTKELEQRLSDEPLDWARASIDTGLGSEELTDLGVRAGCRVALPAHRRTLEVLAGGLVAGYTLDSRATLVAWLKVVNGVAEREKVAFVASVQEEVGGHGAMWHLGNHRPEVVVALELGPVLDDSPVNLNDQPTVWVGDSYSSTLPSDLRLIESVGASLGLQIQHQYVTRGGSDASAAAAQGLCARPVTLGLPLKNSHGFEIIDLNGIDNLANLTAELIKHV